MRKILFWIFYFLILSVAIVLQLSTAFVIILSYLGWNIDAFVYTDIYHYIFITYTLFALFTGFSCLFYWFKLISYAIFNRSDNEFNEIKCSERRFYYDFKYQFICAYNWIKTKLLNIIRFKTTNLPVIPKKQILFNADFHVNNFNDYDFPGDSFDKFFSDFDMYNRHLLDKFESMVSEAYDDRCILLNIIVESCPITTLVDNRHDLVKSINDVKEKRPILMKANLPVDLDDKLEQTRLTYYMIELINKFTNEKIDINVFGSSCDILFSYRYINHDEYEKFKDELYNRIRI